jgi:hypothetical protein
MRWLWIVAVIMAIAGCEDLIQQCVEDRQCTDFEANPGLCIYDGTTGKYCAIRSGACPSQYRWTEAAPKSIETKCVDQALITVDGGTDAAGDGG